MHKGECDIGVRQGIPRDDSVDPVKLVRITGEKLSPSRRIVEQLDDFDARTRGSPHRLDTGRFAEFDS
jgi:hypothetical protein